jgi:hypothetical protein
MQAHYWGIKTFYYSLINKTGVKVQEDLGEPKMNGYHEINMDLLDDADCEACKL